MQEKRIYDKRIAHLEEKVSYGTLGVLERVVVQSSLPPHLQKNVLIINGDTIIRNSFDKTRSDDLNIKQATFDFENLINHFGYFSNGEVFAFVYFNPTIRSIIPEYFSRVITDSRQRLITISTKMTSMLNLKRNGFSHVDHDRVKVFLGIVEGRFNHVMLPGIIQSTIKNHRSFLITHCPFDYFLLQYLPNTDIVVSHTGSILNPNDLGKKVFGDSTIPFNRTTYKLFGDKEFIKGLVRNRPKALQLLNKPNLRLVTEQELIKFAITQLKIDKQQLSWRF